MIVNLKETEQNIKETKTFLEDLFHVVHLYAVMWTQEEEKQVQETLVLHVQPSQTWSEIDCLRN